MGAEQREGRKGKEGRKGLERRCVYVRGSGGMGMREMGNGVVDWREMVGGLALSCYVRRHRRGAEWEKLILEMTVVIYNRLICRDAIK
jgi:hypothetical protein